MRRINLLESFWPRRTSSKLRQDVVTTSKLTLVTAGQSIELASPWTIGRLPSCDLQIDDARVADRHAEIYPVGSLWWIRDLGSDDGTYLNGDIVDAALLEAPSEIRLGTNGPTLRLEVSDDGSEKTRSSSPCLPLPQLRSSLDYAISGLPSRTQPKSNG
ncbi:MAG: FHA domain-containing protein [Deltaproteobacteria bacterium]|nr:FHA domain-containing protein [Deltaproteobacteria bacterium]